MALETTGIGVCAINNCSSRSSSHSEQISTGVCDELRLVLRCLCSNVCAEKGVQYCKITTNCWRVMMGKIEIYELYLDQEETYISTALYCACTEKAPKTSLMQRSTDKTCAQSPGY